MPMVKLMMMKAMILMVTQIWPDPLFGKRAAQRENKRRKEGGGGEECKQNEF